jgi:hypothetical protein
VCTLNEVRSEEVIWFIFTQCYENMKTTPLQK